VCEMNGEAIEALMERAAKLDRGTEALLAERRNTHGDFGENARLSQALKQCDQRPVGMASATCRRKALK
jgi:hypothetical protein